MKVGVISDTHSKEIPQEVLEALKKVDLIIHAGDFCSLKDLKKINRINELKAVYGNMDESEVRQKLPRRDIFQCDGITIGLFHGEGPPKTLLKVVKEEFAGEKVDVIIFGHSHNPMNEMKDNILFFNPGSPNDLVFSPFNSYGILNIEDGQVKGEIIKVKAGNG